MILFRADANSNIGLGHIMRCLSIADALSSITTEPTIVRGKDSIKFVLADETVSELIKSRGYEPIVLHTDYNAMDGEIDAWEELSSSIDADLIIVDSYFVTSSYLSWLKDNFGRVAYIDDVLSFAYPADIVVNYNAYASEADYQRLYCGSSEPEFLLGVEYAPLRSMFQNIPAREQKKNVWDILLSTGGSDELHIAINFLRYLQQHDAGGKDEDGERGLTYHLLIGAMNTDKDEIRSLANTMPNVVIHENVADMKRLICSMDVIISAAGSTLYEVCACGVPLIAFISADNQIPGAKAFEQLGLAVNVGDLRESSSIDPKAVISGTLSSDAVERIMEAVEDLDEDTRISMVRHQRETIDGMGAKRLSERLIEKEEIRTI